MVKFLVLFVLGYFLYRSGTGLIRAVLRDSRGRSEPLQNSSNKKVQDTEIEDAKWVDIE